MRIRAVQVLCARLKFMLCYSEHPMYAAALQKGALIIRKRVNNPRMRFLCLKNIDSFFFCPLFKADTLLFRRFATIPAILLHSHVHRKPIAERAYLYLPPANVCKITALQTLMCLRRAN